MKFLIGLFMGLVVSLSVSAETVYHGKAMLIPVKCSLKIQTAEADGLLKATVTLGTGEAQDLWQFELSEEGYMRGASEGRWIHKVGSFKEAGDYVNADFRFRTNGEPLKLIFYIRDGQRAGGTSFTCRDLR